MPQRDHPHRDDDGTGGRAGPADHLSHPYRPYRLAAGNPAPGGDPAGYPGDLATGDGPARTGPDVRDAREDGLRRLSTLTVAAAVAAVAATGVVAAAAYHAGNPTSDPTAPASAGTDDTDPGGGLQGPAEAPRRADQPPAGVSSGS